jgi:transposase
MAPKRPFSELEWNLTPEPIRHYILYLEKLVSDMARRIEQQDKILKAHAQRLEQLEVRTRKNSKNSSRPPSSDSPFEKARRKKKNKKSKRAKGGQKGHKGHSQQMLEPTKRIDLAPERCSCGHADFSKCLFVPFYTHQQIELPRIEMKVTHWVLNQCDCPQCGQTIKARLPKNIRGGYGPRLCAFIAELSGTKGMSRGDVQDLCQSVFDIPIATGTIQNIIDRSSEAIVPAYLRIGEMARNAWCNYIDETSWFNESQLQWLWAMVNERVALYRVDAHRSNEAFRQLIQDWEGILVSDSYNLYRNWAHGRQTCLAHLIRKANALTERKKRDLRLFGQCMAGHLRQLIRFSKDPPTTEQWSEFYSQLLFSLCLWQDDQTDAGKLARQVNREIDSLRTFLDKRGVEPTNNRAERALRFGVLWRKRSFGTKSEKGKRWVERILSLKETCRLRTKSTFEVLVDCIRSSFNNTKPDLSWI